MVTQCTLNQLVTIQWHCTVHWTSQCTLIFIRLNPLQRLFPRVLPKRSIGSPIRDWQCDWEQLGHIFKADNCLSMYNSRNHQVMLALEWQKVIWKRDILSGTIDISRKRSFTPLDVLTVWSTTYIGRGSIDLSNVHQLLTSSNFFQFVFLFYFVHVQTGVHTAGTNQPQTMIHAFQLNHYSDVIKSAMASLITGVSIVYSTVCSGADQRKYERLDSLVLWGESTDARWIPLTKGQ